MSVATEEVTQLYFINECCLASQAMAVTVSTGNLLSVDFYYLPTTLLTIETVSQSAVRASRLASFYHLEAETFSGVK